MQKGERIAAADSVGAMVEALVESLRLLGAEGESPRDRLAVLRELQRLSNAVAAAQVRVTAAFAEEQRGRGASARGIAADVALARRVGLSAGQRLVAAARTLVEDLPGTMSALESGELSETRATIVAEGVALLEPAAREVVDDSLAGTLPMLGDGEVREAVTTAAATVDPALVERRRLAALRERRVSVRPAADGMAWLSIFTTMAQAAEAELALRKHARSAQVAAALDQGGSLSGASAEAGAGAGASAEAELGGSAIVPGRTSGERTGQMPGEVPTLGELMTEAAIARLTGRETHRGPLIEIQLVATGATLFGDAGTPGREEPARVVGVGSIPAEAARELIRPRRPAAGAAPAGGAARGQPAPENTLAHVRDLDHESRRVTIRRLRVSDDRRDLLGVERRRRFLPPEARESLVPPSPAIGAGAAGGVDVRSRRDPSRLRALRDFLAHPPDLAECADPASAGRLFTGAVRHFVLLRDAVCRVPWCSAPVRHVDHAKPYWDRGPTDADNGQGLCVGHNLAKEDAGWVIVPGECARDGTVGSAVAGADRLVAGTVGMMAGTTGVRSTTHVFTWRSPSGWSYASAAPPLLGWGSGLASMSPVAGWATLVSAPPASTTRPDSPLEGRLAGLLAAA